MDCTESISDLPRTPTVSPAPLCSAHRLPRRRAALSPAQIIAAMKISVYEAFPAQIFITLTGGVFMPAFALALGANNFYIGALAAIPFFANLFQLVGAYFVENFPGRKKLCIVASGIPRILLAPGIIVLLLLFPQNQPLILGLLLVLLILAHAQLSISGVAWLSWMTDVVPEGIRGRYYGLRNSIVSIATVLATFAGGWFLDQQRGSLAAFSLLFLIASLAGVVCAILLSKQPEPPKLPASAPHKNFLRLYRAPFRQPNFRRLLRFSVLWQFAFYFASPFFIVYILTELQVGYSLAALYTVISAGFELLGMRVWGHVSDRTGNKPVMTISAMMVSLLPLLWLAPRKSDLSFYLFIPLLHAAGGFFWAGYNLCSTNLMFRLAPRQRNSIYFGAWAAGNGVAACAGSLLGGALGRWAAQHQLTVFFFSLGGLKVLFLLAGVLRFSAIPFLRPVRERAGLRTLQALQLLRRARNWWLILQDKMAPPAGRPAPEKFDETKFWPLFRRTKSFAL